MNRRLGVRETSVNWGPDLQEMATKPPTLLGGLADEGEGLLFFFGCVGPLYYLKQPFAKPSSYLRPKRLKVPTPNSCITGLKARGLGFRIKDLELRFLGFGMKFLCRVFLALHRWLRGQNPTPEGAKRVPSQAPLVAPCGKAINPGNGLSALWL